MSMSKWNRWAKIYLHSRMRRCKILLSLLLAAHGASAFAADLYQFPPVYVSATRIPRELAALGRRVVVLDSAAIAERAATSITDLLISLPGFHPRTRGPFGVQTDLEMAGATFSQVLLLVDGMRVNDPQTGHHNLNLPLRPEDLERVEVLYGAGSSVHGPDAFGGVINLVPRRHPARHLELASRWGRSLDAGRVVAVGSEATLRYGWNGARGSLSFAAGKDRSGGYREETDFDIDRLFLSARFAVAGGQLRLHSGVEDKGFGANDFYAPYPSREWTRAWLYGAQFQHPLQSDRDLIVRAYYRRHRDRFVLTVADPSLYENRHLSELATLESYLDLHRGDSSYLILGGEVIREGIDSSNLGDHVRYRGALFTEYSSLFGRFGLGAGARLDRSRSYPREISPSLRLSYALPSAQLYAAVGRAFRAPSFTEFYYRDPANVGNPDLKAERAWSLETGLAFQPRRSLRAQTALFVRFENDLVDYVRAVDTPPWTARNLGRVRTLGVQMDLSYNGWQRLHFDLGYTWHHKTRVLASGYESKYVFTHPRHLLLVGLFHPLVAGFTSRWQFTFRESYRGDDYALADLVLSRRFGHGRVQGRIRNLTDKRYETVAGVPMPGRWFGIETLFDL